MYTEWIQHKGKKVLYRTFNGAKTQDEMIEILKEYHDIIKEEPGKVLTIVDLTNAALGPDVIKVSKTLGKENAHKLEKSAVLGITGLKRMLLKGYNLFTQQDNPPFETKEEALEYVTS